MFVAAEWELLLSSAIRRHFRLNISLVKGHTRALGIPFTPTALYMAARYGGKGGLTGWPGSISLTESLLVYIKSGLILVTAIFF